MENTGIVRNELAGERHAAAWKNLIGLDRQKDQLVAWGALTLRVCDRVDGRSAGRSGSLGASEPPWGFGRCPGRSNVAGHTHCTEQARGSCRCLSNIRNGR